MEALIKAHIKFIDRERPNKRRIFCAGIMVSDRAWILEST